MWELIASGGNVGTIRAALLEQFDVDEATVREDLELLLAELTKQGIVTIAG